MNGRSQYVGALVQVPVVRVVQEGARESGSLVDLVARTRQPTDRAAHGDRGQELPARRVPLPGFEDEPLVAGADSRVVQPEAACSTGCGILEPERDRDVVFAAADEVAARIQMGNRAPRGRRDADIRVFEEVPLAAQDAGEAEGDPPGNLAMDSQGQFIGEGLPEVRVHFVPHGNEDAERLGKVHLSGVHQVVEVPVFEAESRGRAGIRVFRNPEHSDRVGGGSAPR